MWVYQPDVDAWFGRVASIGKETCEVQSLDEGSEDYQEIYECSPDWLSSEEPEEPAAV